MWHHIQHKSSGSSEAKFVNSLEEISTDSGRVKQYNIESVTDSFAVFNTVCDSKSAIICKGCSGMGFFRHSIEKDVKKWDKMHCPACGKTPLSGSSDANMK